MYVLASQMESKADMSPVMTGAAFGQPMSKALHQAWGAIPGSKVKVRSGYKARIRGQARI